MGLLSRITGAVKRYAPATRPKKDQPPGGFSWGTGWFGGPAFTDAFRARRAPSPYQLVEKHKSLIYAMVARNRDAVTRIPLRLYADGSRVQGGRPRGACDPIRVSRHIGARLARAGMVSSGAVDQVYEIRNHPILDVIRKPDPYGLFNMKSLIGLLVSYMDVVGSAYLVPEGNGWDWQRGKVGKTAPEHLWVIYPQYVIPIRNAGTPIVDYWQYFRDRLPAENTIWFRQAISLRDAYGSAYSPTYAGDVYADQEDRWMAIVDQVLGLGPRPSMVASAKDPMMPPTDDQAKRLEQDMQRKHSAGNAGNILVNPGGYEFTPLSFPPADLGAKDGSEYVRNNLATVFGQPPTFYVTDTNLANLEAARDQHARNAVEPRCDTIEGTLTALVQQWDPRLFFKFDPAIAEDDEMKEKVISMRLASGRTTINQENEEDRWPAVDYGDKPWLPGTLKQPDMIRAEHEQGLETQKAQIEQGDKALEQGDKGLEHDGKRVEIEKKKAAQKPVAGRAASLDEEEAALILRAKFLIGELEGEEGGMSRLDALRSMVADLEHTLVVRTGGGNPNHDAEGKFATGPGGHGKHWARRQRRKHKLHKLRRGYRAEIAGQKREHRGQRSQMVKAQRGEREALDHHYRHEAHRAKRQHVKELERHDKAAHKEVASMERRRERERASESTQHAKGKITTDHIAKFEAAHQQDVASIKDLNDRTRKGLVEGHKDELEGIHIARKEHGARMEAEHKGERKGLLKSQREERREKIEGIKGELADLGFKKKGAKGGERDGLLEGVARGRGRGRGQGFDSPGAHPGEAGADRGQARRFGSGRTAKASSAESIIRHCLRRLGLWVGYKRGELTGKERLEALVAIREYGMAWMHHEAEQLFRVHGRVVDGERLDTGRSLLHGSDLGGGDRDVTRALAGAIRSHVGRFFSRAKQFVRELIVAGAMAMGGPEPLGEADVAAADHAAQEQQEYLDRFHNEVLLNPPAELQEPSALAVANPMTAAEFAARAEKYGGSVWGASLNHDRDREIRRGRFDQERRVHMKPMGEHDACGTCRGESAKGWVRIGSLLPIGDSECMGINCDCHFEYRRAA